MKEKYIRLKAMLLTGVIAITCSALTGCGDEIDTHTDSKQAIVVQEVTKRFGVGEHIISVPIKKDVRDKNFQYEYHPGYEPVGISLTAYGQLYSAFGGGAIIYTNNREVECSTSITDGHGNNTFLDFGIPVEYIQEVDLNNDDIKAFDVGEHIISVPIKKDVRDKNFQYEYHEGYEVVGIAATAQGRSFNGYGGGIVLYKNIVPVKCIHDDNGYTSFGIPFEVEKTKTLK